MGKSTKGFRDRLTRASHLSFLFHFLSFSEVLFSMPLKQKDEIAVPLQRKEFLDDT